MLEQLVATDLAGVFLVFCGVGSALMVMPGFGDSYVSPRVRLLFALAFALVVAPVVAPSLPRPEGGLFPTAGLLVTEVGVGLFVGMVARVLISALQVAGTVLSFQSGLANAFSFDAVSAQQGALFGGMLSMLGVVLIFVTDMHHLLLAALVDSYVVFVPGALPPIGDFSDTIAQAVTDSFRIGLQLAAPFILSGVVVTLGMGLLARLMPQVQVFFIALPVQIGMGLIVLALTLSTGMLWFLAGFEDGLRRFLLTG